jgi:hypothetical protein
MSVDENFKLQLSSRWIRRPDRVTEQKCQQNCERGKAMIKELLSIMPGH